MDNPQALEQCLYCVSKVKANRMSIHIGRCHKNVSGKQQCLLHTDHRVDDLHQHLEDDDCSGMVELKKSAYDSGGICTVPEPPPCNINFGENLETWDNANYPTYDPLESTKSKNIIRGSYASGLKPAERKNVIEEERARRAELAERENADRLNRINYSQNNVNGFGQRSNMAKYSTSNSRSVVGYRMPSKMTLDSESDVCSVSTQSLHNSNSINTSLIDVTNNDCTTDSDGFVPVNYNRRSQSTISVTRGRGRGKCNPK